ncbi:hypothetical protein [Actinokineospora sp. NBRC 105648]|uniref:hypothetical protein n=1 Tax=Actinokineospora sp. NBRC 105648 TaxID=3032206 RepID=UPI0024A2F96C|nr:hypothetical protein [Actinokineospora sp. NBRC 105648]GLZ43408.1 hypothetical protein Acsp05_70320 [Actinokineospora sp. NBRC 105648]
MRLLLAVALLAVAAVSGCADRTPPAAESRPDRVARPVAPPAQTATEVIPLVNPVWTVRAR